MAVALFISRRRMLADPVFIIVDHDEVVRTAEHHGSGDSSLFSNAMSFISDNQVFFLVCQKAPSSQY
jgi:hypothetical protein